MGKKEIEDLLQVPLKSLKPLTPVETFKTIAEKLINNYCIKCGNNEYYLAEIEFYYYREKDKDCFEEGKKNWEEITYPRKTNAGDLFFHLSGMDICFKSDLKKDKRGLVGYGGGILIRAIVDANNPKKLIVGPLTCKDVILNSCEGKEMPSLEPASRQRNITPSKAYRYLGKTDFDSIAEQKNRDGTLELAFYDSNIQEEEWNYARSSYYSSRLKPNFAKERN